MMTESKPFRVKPVLAGNAIVVATSWLIIGILLNVFWQDLINALWFFAGIVKWLYWGGGVLLLAIMVIKLFLGLCLAEFRIGHLIAGVMLVAGGLTLFEFGPEYGFFIRFQLVKSQYEDILRQIPPTTPIDHRDDRFYSFGDDVIVDQGPPQRVAFVLSGGILDNFQAIVYDPSGFVMETRYFNGWSNWNDPTLQPVKNLFGGDMFHCTSLEGAWYLCLFT